MKRVLLLSLMLITISVTSQVTNQGSPLSWKLLSDQDQIAAKALPSFDLEQVRAEDALNDYKFDKPWRFGLHAQCRFRF